MTQTSTQKPPGRDKKHRNVDATIETLRSQLGRVPAAPDERERKSFDELLKKAAASQDHEYKRQVVGYVRSQFEIMFGPDQFLMPFLGIVATLLLPVGLSVFAIILDDTGPLGIRGTVFATVFVAGMAGGIVRVLYNSVHKNHVATSQLQLFFTGVVHPLIGAMLALSVMAAFRSGLIAYPVSDADKLVPGGAKLAWTQGEIFVVFSGFIAGLFEEKAIALMSRLAPGALGGKTEKKSSGTPEDPPAPTQ